ncbi:chemotaxis protein CheX [Acetivibrio cellulolyticus]|uniref:chemotaxis protein CheX n=1 Tax=Acetivibrio cellulolyticus TaxID=35830 RepID=UPI0001E2E35B|nr:chemotaxis protein CheX [Acetivibrio cellulolyticus]
MDKRLSDPFFSSTREIIKQMADIDININEVQEIDNSEIVSYGVASIINFSGKIKGRFMIDLEADLALKIAGNILGEPCTNLKNRIFVAAISELNNVIAGDANTYINNNYSLDLRLATPVVYSGKNIVIVTSKIISTTLLCSTVYGKMKLNVGFQGGLV